MSRTLSSNTLKAIYASETEDVFLVLLTLNHDSLQDPIRITSDSVMTQSRGDDYIPFPFELVLPDETENRAPRARLTIDNVSREVLTTIRTLNTPAKMTMEIVRFADSNQVEAVFPDFILTNVKYNALSIQADLTIEDFTAEPYPATIFAPSGFPGLF